MIRHLSLACLTLLLTTAACGSGDDGSDDVEQPAGETPANADQGGDNGAEGGGAAGTMPTQCDENVPSDGACDPMMACAAYDPDCTDEDLDSIPVPPVTDEDAAGAAGGGPAGGSQLTECDENVPSDGACDPMMACAAYDPDCTAEDLDSIPIPPVTDDAAAAAAGGGPAGGTQLTECDENMPEDGVCDENAPCAGFDPDCGYDPPDCELEPASDGECDLQDECWGYDPDCE